MTSAGLIVPVSTASEVPVPAGQASVPAGPFAEVGAQECRDPAVLRTAAEVDVRLRRRSPQPGVVQLAHDRLRVVVDGRLERAGAADEIAAGADS